MTNKQPGTKHGSDCPRLAFWLATAALAQPNDGARQNGRQAADAVARKTAREKNGMGGARIVLPIMMKL